MKTTLFLFSLFFEIFKNFSIQSIFFQIFPFNQLAQKNLPKLSTSFLNLWNWKTALLYKQIMVCSAIWQNLRNKEFSKWNQNLTAHSDMQGKLTIYAAPEHEKLKRKLCCFFFEILKWLNRKKVDWMEKIVRTRIRQSLNFFIFKREMLERLKFSKHLNELAMKVSGLGTCMAESTDWVKETWMLLMSKSAIESNTLNT